MFSQCYQLYGASVFMLCGRKEMQLLLKRCAKLDLRKGWRGRDMNEEMWVSLLLSWELGKVHIPPLIIIFLIYSHLG